MIFADSVLVRRVGGPGRAWTWSRTHLARVMGSLNSGFSWDWRNRTGTLSTFLFFFPGLFFHETSTLETSLGGCRSSYSEHHAENGLGLGANRVRVGWAARGSVKLGVVTHWHRSRRGDSGGAEDWTGAWIRPVGKSEFLWVSNTLGMGRMGRFFPSLTARALLLMVLILWGLLREGRFFLLRKNGCRTEGERKRSEGVEWESRQQLNLADG